jgi:CBS domain-containing protein
MYQVSNAMTREFVSVAPHTSVSEAIDLLLDHDISGMPVVDAGGKLVGLITQFQLLEVLYDPDLRNSCVQDFMSRELITINESDLLSLAANLLILHRIRRLPVLNNGQLVGIVSRGDLLRYFRQSGDSIQAWFDRLREWNEPVAVG